jgi:hypothetical protein
MSEMMTLPPTGKEKLIKGHKITCCISLGVQGLRIHKSGYCWKTVSHISIIKRIIFVSFLYFHSDSLTK